MKTKLLSILLLSAFTASAQNIELPVKDKPDDKACPEGYVLIHVDRYHWKCVDERAGSSLPVTLVYFKGGQVGNDIVLYWSTATELYSSHFEVQGSNDAKQFETTGRVESAGNTYQQQYYRFKPAIYTYYRLVQVDLDGSTTAYQIITVPFKPGAYQEKYNVIGQKF